MLRNIGIAAMALSIVAFVALRAIGVLRYELPSRIVKGEIPLSEWPTQTNYATNWLAVAIVTFGFVAGLICALLPESAKPASSV
jgi:hypothetical protein